MLKTFHNLGVLLAALALSACATQLVPIGDWGRPADLGLTSDSLKGIRVNVKCGSLRHSAGVIVEQASKACAVLERQLTDLGATDPKGGETDLTLWYVEGEPGKTQNSGLASLAFWFSGGIVPYVTTCDVNAELRVTDGRGVLLDRAPLQLEEIVIVGWGALLALHQKQPDISSKLFHFVQNRVASQALRLHQERL